MNITNTLHTLQFQKRAFFILAFFAVLALCAYVYFVNQTVWNVVSRQNAVKSIHQVSSDLAMLEASYMSLSSSLTLDQAYLLGFKEVVTEDTMFVERPVPSVALR